MKFFLRDRSELLAMPPWTIASVAEGAFNLATELEIFARMSASGTKINVRSWR